MKSEEEQASARLSRVGAILVAAGSSTRMEGKDKASLILGGSPLIFWPLRVLCSSPLVQQTVLVVREDKLSWGSALIEQQGWGHLVGICAGGPRRQDSVAKGLKMLRGCEWVVVHDGARPFLSTALLEQGLKEAATTGAAVAAVPVKDTIKVVGADGVVEETPRRDALWATQTPQVFRFDLLAEAHRHQEDASDDASMVENLGHRVRVYMGSYSNIKITTPEDLLVAEALLGSLS